MNPWFSFALLVGALGDRGEINKISAGQLVSLHFFLSDLISRHFFLSDLSTHITCIQRTTTHHSRHITIMFVVRLPSGSWFNDCGFSSAQLDPGSTICARFVLCVCNCRVGCLFSFWRLCRVFTHTPRSPHVVWGPHYKTKCGGTSLR